MIVEGKECLVICTTLLMMGDTPALKRTCGYSPSISPACYVRMPCMVCDVLMENLRLSIVDPLLRGKMRDPVILRGLFDSNNKMTGVPKAAWIIEALKQQGFLRFSEWLRTDNQPDPRCLGLDDMHAVFRGALIKHFCVVVDILTDGDAHSRKTRAWVWRTLSSEFNTYCRDNGISAFWNFSSENEFTKRMSAGSIREFAKVSCAILRKVGLVRDTAAVQGHAGYANWQKQVRTYNFWSLHCNIALIIEQHSISALELKALDELIRKLLVHFYHELPGSFVTINVHYYTHLVDQIRRLGPARIVANNSREHLIQKIKPYYRNTNHRQTETTVLSRYVVGLFMKVTDYLRDFENIMYSR